MRHHLRSFHTEISLEVSKFGTSGRKGVIGEGFHYLRKRSIYGI